MARIHSAELEVAITTGVRTKVVDLDRAESRARSELMLGSCSERGCRRGGLALPYVLVTFVGYSTYSRLTPLRFQKQKSTSASKILGTFRNDFNSSHLFPERSAIFPVLSAAGPIFSLA